MGIIEGTYQEIITGLLLYRIHYFTHLTITFIHFANIGQSYLQTAVFIRFPVIETLQQSYPCYSEHPVILQESCFIYTRNRETPYPYLVLHEIDIGPGAHIQSQHIGYVTGQYYPVVSQRILRLRETAAQHVTVKESAVIVVADTFEHKAMKGLVGTDYAWFVHIWLDTLNSALGQQCLKYRIGAFHRILNYPETYA